MIYTSGKLSIEVDGDGYFKAYICHKTIRRLKLRVVKNRIELIYDLNSNGDPEVFPTQLGNGRYEITLCENLSGNKYAKVGTINLFVKMEDKNAPYLHANQYINYSDSSDVVLKARALCIGKTDEQKFVAIRNYIKQSFVYDFIKAATTKTFVLPDIEHSFSNHRGICQDLAAIAVAMFRSQGIPSKLCIGYVDRQYHSWSELFIDGEWQLYDPTCEINSLNKIKNYKLERWY